VLLMTEPETEILIIDDDQTIHVAVQTGLAGMVDRLFATSDPLEGIRLATQQHPDLILLDINMPKMDGLKVCRHLRETPSTRDIPIIFLTVDRDIRHLAKALDCGGSDYILKPFNGIELQARVRAAMRTKRLIDLLKDQARIDGLTGLQNRAALDDTLRAAAAAYERAGQAVSLMMIDIDHFKAINDEHGHGVGDEVLRQIGNTIRRSCRPYDIACRFGGDEFAVVLGLTEGSDAEQVAGRLFAQLSNDGTPGQHRAFAFTTSAGLVSTATLDGCMVASEFLKSADAALYTAKREGRARLVVGTTDTLG
jgi:two-component system cell cycle response regulator